MKRTELKLTIENFGVFSVDYMMGIKFETDVMPGVYWHSHASKLNQKDYTEMFNSFNDFWEDNDLYSYTAYFLLFDEFKEIGEQLFQMYCILRSFN
ncbi:hypothetical protein ACQ31_gp124 [Salmonella phage STML-198]|uniref:Uncharacterized protein n=1 Tax=Salmonella phage STML-198 TaxID=1204531 RepID=K4I408_9CAUD|nr:hypothetical protein ACQ31_gp124 [Salmonella phage STML-198]AFU64007.1 hypothetical protein [Salmonella phage STML-198]